MANTVNVTVLENGPRHVFVHVYLRADGATGDMSGQTLVDPYAQLNVGTPGALGMAKDQRLRLGRIEYNFSGFDAVISFGSGDVTPNYKWVLTEGANCPVDFRPWTFIMDNSGLNGNEKVLISTTGFTSTTDQGSLLIELIK